jgi:hypothetical protein
MNTRPSLYRSTLIAAALAIGCLGATAAQAHDHGWRDSDRGWHDHDRGWRERERGGRDHDGYRGYGPRYGYAPAAWREGGYAPPVADAPALPGYGAGGVSVVVRLPF